MFYRAILDFFHERDKERKRPSRSRPFGEWIDVDQRELARLGERTQLASRRQPFKPIEP